HCPARQETGHRDHAGEAVRAACSHGLRRWPSPRRGDSTLHPDHGGRGRVDRAQVRDSRMNRKIWRYAGGVGLLLAIGPRTFAWRRWCWGIYLPWAEENAVLCFWRNWVLFTLRYP